MKVVFLDIDGVVLPFGAYQAQEMATIFTDPMPFVKPLAARAPKPIIERLRKTAIELDSKFVLISSWRGVFSEDFLRAWLDDVGLWDLMHANWAAPMKGAPPRPVKGRDIGLWLAEHTVAQHECIVLDDEDLGLRENFGFAHIKQVRPLPEIGYSLDDAGRVAKIAANMAKLNKA